jgi:hypothetical protein
VAAIKWQHTTINRELMALVEGVLKRRHKQGGAYGEGRGPIVWGDNWRATKKNMKFIVALDGHQLML